MLFVVKTCALPFLAALEPYVRFTFGRLRTDHSQARQRRVRVAYVS